MEKQPLRSTIEKKTSSEKTKNKIVRGATKALLKRRSLASTSITDICAAARLTRPTIYHYFGNSRNLFLAVHMACMEKSSKHCLEKAISIDDPGGD